MQILFISDETEVFKFLSGMQAKAMMPQGQIEISGMSEDSVVTVICSGSSTHYPATIISINSGFQTQYKDLRWLGVNFLVRRVNSHTDYEVESQARND